jgi:predicted metal-binding membrane protein
VSPTVKVLVAPWGERPAPLKAPVPVAVVLGIVAAWVGLVLAELRGAPMSHDALAGGSVPLAAALGIFGLAWVAMVVAMMLPSSYRMLRVFGATSAEPGGRLRRLAPFLIGYLVVWTVFGFVLFAADLGIHAVLDGSTAPSAAHGTLTGDALLIAGAYQLTERKRRCLSRCRPAAEPAGAVGVEPAAGARGDGFRAGLTHGLNCLGSGWALMLAVFALGSPQIVWMAMFGGVMAYEKVGRHGTVAARLAGVALLVASLVATVA